MSQHTPEPWHTGGNGTIIYDKDGWGIASATVYHGRQETGEAEANARRIAACVNACAGIPMEALEAFNDWSKAGVASCATYRAQRDELLAALKYHQEQTRPIQRTIDVIAKCGGDE